MDSYEELCDHVGTERTTRTAHGYLWDAPRGTVEVMCVDCGTTLDDDLDSVVTDDEYELDEFALLDPDFGVW